MADSHGDFLVELETARKAAQEAGAVIMALYGKDFEIREKTKNNPVTAADLEANLKIREIILGRFPGDGWLSEEDKDNPKRLKTARVWVVDPIDGTKEFIEGVPQFAVSIGFVYEGRPVAGVVYNPAQEKLFCAAKGSGATLNGSPIQVSSRTDLKGSHLLVSRTEPRRKFRSFDGLCRLEPVGSIAFRMAMVGAGEGDGTLTFRSINEWDICGGVMVVQEAGGAVLDGGGNELVFNRESTVHRGVVAANPGLATTLQGMVAEILSATNV
jgi:myo-inositol-1(or 4)-monophosphatase